MRIKVKYELRNKNLKNKIYVIINEMSKFLKLFVYNL